MNQVRYNDRFPSRSTQRLYEMEYSPLPLLHQVLNKSVSALQSSFGVEAGIRWVLLELHLSFNINLHYSGQKMHNAVHEWNERRGTTARETVITFFFLLDIPFSFCWASCSSSSESESAFFFETASAAVSSFFSFSLKDITKKLAQVSN